MDGAELSFWPFLERHITGFQEARRGTGHGSVFTLGTGRAASTGAGNSSLGAAAELTELEIRRLTHDSVLTSCGDCSQANSCLGLWKFIEMPSALRRNGGGFYVPGFRGTFRLCVESIGLPSPFPLP